MIDVLKALRDGETVTSPSLNKARPVPTEITYWAVKTGPQGKDFDVHNSKGSTSVWASLFVKFNDWEIVK